MKNITLFLFIFFVSTSIFSQSQHDTIRSIVPKFSVGYTLGSHLEKHPSHLFALEYSKDKINVFKLEAGYIYKDNFFEENDSKIDDIGLRVMFTYLKLSKKRNNLYHGVGVIYRRVNVGNIGGIPNSSNDLEIGQYYLKSTLTGLYYQLSKKVKIIDRLQLSFGARLGFGVLNTNRDRGIDPDYEVKSPGWGGSIFGSGSLLGGCWFFCQYQEVGSHPYPIVDFHVTLSYSIFN